MTGFSQLTVVSVTGAQSRAAGAGLAVEHALRALPGSRGLLLSPQRPEGLPPDVRHVAIEAFGYFEYTLFMLYALQHFVETDFVLTVQDDGWVLDAANWRDEFFAFDYLGAPTHLARVTTDGRAALRHRFEWTPRLQDGGSAIEHVYNGGFSLRSRRLLEAPTSLELEFRVPRPALTTAPPYAMHWSSVGWHEDVWLCLTARAQLEAAGLKFPSLATARRFSIEHAAPRLHTTADLQQVFGHHSRSRRLVSLAPPTLACDLTEEEVAGFFGERALLQRFARLGYVVRFGSTT